MPPSSDLHKHTLNLFEGDYAKLQDMFPDMGAGAVIRRIVRTFINRVEEKGVAIVDAEIDVKL